MNINEKYNVECLFDQFGAKIDRLGIPVNKHWIDQQELILIEKFEKDILNLINSDKTNYTMIELGSGWAYYSMLFKKILKDYNTINVMLEPDVEKLKRGEDHFKHNNLTDKGKNYFYNNSIGNIIIATGENVSKKTKSFQSILDECNISKLDVLHCDIDASEIFLLKEIAEILDKNIISNIYLLTHGIYNHRICRSILKEFNYNISLDIPNSIIGYDSLLIANKET